MYKNAAPLTCAVNHSDL